MYDVSVYDVSIYDVSMYDYIIYSTIAAMQEYLNECIFHSAACHESAGRIEL
jgi:hypothetical protein